MQKRTNFSLRLFQFLAKLTPIDSNTIDLINFSFRPKSRTKAMKRKKQSKRRRGKTAESVAHVFHYYYPYLSSISVIKRRSKKYEQKIMKFQVSQICATQSAFIVRCFSHKHKTKILSLFDISSSGSSDDDGSSSSNSSSSSRCGI